MTTLFRLSRPRHVRKALLLVAGLAALLAVRPAAAQDAGSARLKDLVVVEGATPVQLTGYGLVVGLDRTGDRARGSRGSVYTVQSIANMLRTFGITVDAQDLASRNAAAVMVTAVLDPYSGAGMRLDVTVSALGDARSLSGGVLLQTPLLDPITRQVYAIAQGPVATGSVLASSVGSSVQVNHSNTGRVPNGALVTKSVPVELAGAQQLGLVLKRPDFSNASRIANALNESFPGTNARVEHAGIVRVDVASAEGGAPGFLAAMEAVNIAVDVPARVIINERTGTIVAGGNIRLSEVMVTHGGITVSTQVDEYVSQPAPFSGGETVVGRVGEAAISEDVARSVVLPPNTDVTQLATALNDLGLTARDIIAIFQAIDRAGALQGELVIL